MNSHGHVVPNPDGSKARCGGPGLCSTCSREAAVEWRRLKDRKCKWTDYGGGEYDTSCGHEENIASGREPYDFCPHCGGKVETEELPSPWLNENGN